MCRCGCGGVGVFVGVLVGVVVGVCECVCWWIGCVCAWGCDVANFACLRRESTLR